jgi:hypothetical protein
MNEYFLLVIAYDKAVAFCLIKEFYCTGFH